MSKQPNIVVVLTDDQGWGDLSLTGNTNLSTPHIDKLGQQGAVFDSFFVQPLCAPTRAELLTGRYFTRTGVRGVSRRLECLNLDETTLGDIFKSAGYATGCFGKWHSGSAYPYHPNGRGFDEFYGFCCGHWSHYFDSTLEHNGEQVKSEGYIVDALTDKAMSFMEDNKDRPFLCYVPYNTPHSPFQVPDRWFNKFKDHELPMRHENVEDEVLHVTRSALAMCENIDWNVGRLVNKVTEMGLIENTIFVYSTDNGPNGWRWNGGMSGKKGSTDEGGVRSPCIISWQGTIPEGNQIKQIAGAIDLLPTLSDLADIELITNKPLDGASLKPLLMQQTEDWPEREVYAQSPDGKTTSIRTQQYRAGGHSGGLYHMDTDIGQKLDLSNDLSDIYEDLQNRIHEWREDAVPVGTVDRPIPVGYSEFPNTFLNAQDAIPAGNITWSSVHPNASYFINWTNIDDDIKWDIDIQSSGLYEITLMYACRHGEEGSDLEAVCQNSSVRAQIIQPFESPLKDQDDRVERREAYDKEFTSLKMGEVKLEKGRAALQLKALSKSGVEVCEVRTIRIRLLS